MKPIAFNWQAGTADDPSPQIEHTPPLRRKQVPAVAFSCKDHGADASEELAPTLRSMTHDGSHANGGGQLAVAIQAGATRENPASGPDGVGVQSGIAYTLEARAEVQAVAFTQNQRDEVRQMDVAGALASEPGMKQQTYLAFESRLARNGRGAPSEVVPPLKAQSGETGKGDAAPLMFSAMQVRRLSVRECERLQGFPDDWTNVPYRGKPAADGPRYKALGNSMACNVMQWLGERIAMVDGIMAAADEATE